MDRNSLEVEQLPGFRFHPTEDELLDIFLRGALMGRKTCHNIINTINLYHFDPWELPGLANIGEREWYFFVPRERKYASGGRPNRTTKNGFWKATGTDRPVRSCKQPGRVIGLKKTLVFYKGRPQSASKTDWIMNEYRFPEDSSMPEKDIVLCKVYRKATPMRVLEQRAAQEEKPVLTQGKGVMPSLSARQKDALTERSTESEDESRMEKGEGWLKRDVMELQLPMHASFDNWIQDPCLLLSPWFKSWADFADMVHY